MPARQTMLLIDRIWVSNDHGHRRAIGEPRFTIAPPPKPAAPFLIADKPWEAMSTGWGTMLYDAGTYRLWYEAWDETYTDDCDGRLCYAESDDGVTWRKPSLGLIEYRGSRDNNILADASTFNGLGFHGSCVFIDPTSPPAARYRMTFLTSARKYVPPHAIAGLHLVSYAYSADGLRWTWGVPPCIEGVPRRSWLTPPVTAFGSDTQSVVMWDPELRGYVGYFRTWDMPRWSRTIGRSFTHDLGNWPLPQTIIAPDERDPWGSDLYNNAASRYASGGDVAHFIFTSVFEHASDTLSVQLATSRDGVRYNRADRSAFIAQGETFDRGGAYTCPGVIQRGDECLLSYHAVSYKHGEAVPSKIRHAGTYVQLRFPRDRFQGLGSSGESAWSMVGVNNPGTPIRFTLNADIAKGGAIRAGLQRAHANTADFLPGFAPADCEVVTGDGIDLELRWKGGRVIPRDTAPGLDLRLLVDNAVVYAVNRYV